jgi:epoxyqueuosine reductase
MTEFQLSLVQAIKMFVTRSVHNRLKDIDGSPMWEEPLVGFADGDDQLFGTFKSVVGPFHLTPRAALAAHSEHPMDASTNHGARVAVVSWILPVAEATRLSNAQMTEGPSLQWNHTRFQGEEFNDSLRRHVVRLLEERGYVAVAPVLTSSFRTKGLASTWSERHIAFAAGLGTFGLSDGLITARGIAHRCGSVVFNAACLPTPRRYTHHQEYCPYPFDASCGVCIQRCPAGAISAAGHDKVKCQAYMKTALADWVKKPGYLGSYVACGLCQTNVPCESQIP